LSRFALITWIWIALGTVVAIVMPLSTFYWSGSIFYGSYLAIFICGLFLIRMNFFCKAICRGRAGQKRIALTFDDGPDPVATPPLLDVLKREEIPATFFCIGENVLAHPDLSRRIAAEGHLLGNHSYTHPWYINLLSRSALSHQLDQTQDAIQSGAGTRAKYFRPPSGMTGPMFPKALARAGLTLVGWDVRSLDTVLSPQKAVDRILRLARDGSIIVLHDGDAAPQRIIEIVTAAARELRARGFTFARLDQLIEGSPATEEPVRA
jgi:peptidoglycan-N-acetylglucosamine deacetylase